MNVKSLFRKSILELKKAGIETPELDARILLNEAMKREPAFVFSHPEYLITNAQYSKFRRYIRRRKKGEPVAYITGHKEFYGYDFLINKQVLIPRPESEWLVEKGIEFLSRYKISTNNYNGIPKCHSEQREESLGSSILRSFVSVSAKPSLDGNTQDDKIKILDIGTGSGCLAISFVKELEKQFNNLTIEQLSFYAVDFNKRGLVIAKKNACRLKTDEIVFLNSNLFSSHRIKNKVFDLILANLPYVPYHTSNESRVTSREIYFEPQDSIFADDNGTATIKKFLIDAKSHLSPRGAILIELDPRNANDLMTFAKKTYPKTKINLEKDLAGLNRYLVIEL